jgi:hypothetical protein
MIHNEHLNRADTLYECRHDGRGNAIHAIIKDGEAVIYSTLQDLIDSHYFFEPGKSKMYLREEQLEQLYECESYKFFELLNYAMRKNML